MVEVSIVITAYNYENYIEECIESCVNQRTSVAYETIVIDDGSTDGTYEKASAYKSPRLRVVTKGNEGIEASSNLGFRMAAGKFIVRVDADDKLHLDYIETVTKVLRKTAADFAYPDYYIMNAKSEVTGQAVLPDFDAEEILSRGDFLATGTMFRKEVFQKIGLYSERVKNCGLENYEWILKLLLEGGSGVRVPKALFFYRVHGLNISTVKRERIIAYGVQLFKQLHLGAFKTNQYHPYGLRIQQE